MLRTLTNVNWFVGSQRYQVQNSIRFAFYRSIPVPLAILGQITRSFALLPLPILTLAPTSNSGSYM
ncbi:MAG: hypothetical protein JWM91_1262 [Rhodospirillales bacterium]|nr:hypothetical protein [Rhodospirillales bacterium]